MLHPGFSSEVSTVKFFVRFRDTGFQKSEPLRGRQLAKFCGIEIE